jgi:hypothetical protein
MEHKMKTDCGSGDCGGTCFICCCGICDACGLAEGALTTHCPGTGVNGETQDAIHAGKKDFIDGEWRNQCSPYSPRVSHPKEGHVNAS